MSVGAMYHGLPCELIREVLSMAVHNDLKTTVKLLTVCRRTYEWISPILYQQVTLADPESLLLFARTLCSNPLLPSLVRVLWIGPRSTPRPFLPSFIDERDWRETVFPRALRAITSKCKYITRLAIISSPIISVANWSRVEQNFSIHLRSLVLGPEHGMLQNSPAYKHIQHFCSIDTTLSYVELRRMATFPSLAHMQWRSYSEPLCGTLGEKLAVVLESPSLKAVKIIHADPSMPHDWTISSASDQRVQFIRQRFADNWLAHLYAEWRRGELG